MKEPKARKASEPAPKHDTFQPTDLRQCQPAGVTEVMIAQMAVHFLPKIELPERWATMNHTKLSGLIQEPTEFLDPRILDEPVEVPITPFEVIAEEAVRRARLVFLAAHGYKRPARTAYEQKNTARGKRILDYIAQREEWGKKFDKQIAKLGLTSLTAAEALRVVMPKSTDHVRGECFRQWRELEIAAAKDGLKSRAHGSEKRNLPEEQSLSMELNFEDFVHLAFGLRRFYDTHGAAVTKALQRKAGKAGGKESAKTKRAKVETEAAKYGGGTSASPSFGRRDDDP